MKYTTYQLLALKVPRTVAAVLLAASLIGCSFIGTGVSKPKPAELGANVSVLGVRQVWSAQLGSQSSAQLAPHVNGTTVTLASADGVVAAIDARTGGNIWELQLRESLAVGVGSDGRWTAVVSQSNELIVLEAGLEQWRQRLPAQVHTSPLVAGNRVFILAADRTVMAFDAANGNRLWIQPRPGDALILRQPGVLVSVGNSLLAGISGRLLNLNPDTGAIRWEVPLASPRGTNDVERLVELVGPVSRNGDSVCARAFQSAVGCIDVKRATVNWTHLSNGVAGLGGDAAGVYGAESNGIVSAWNRETGAKKWSSDYLKYRNLTAPLLLGRSVVVADDSGLVHFLSSEDGTPLNRIATDESGISVPPVVAADTLIIATRKGNVFGFRPD